LIHPNICRVLDQGVLSNTKQVFGVFEYIEGLTLTRLIETEGPMNADRFCNVFSALCAAMEFAHQSEKCIILRNLNPDNIIIRKVDGLDQPVIIDFDCADALNDPGRERLWQMGEFVGLPAGAITDKLPPGLASYFSPELCIGYKITPASDVYSMACCMFYALTGTPPFVGTTLIDTMQMQIADHPVMTRVPVPFEQILHKAFEKRAEDRLQTMTDFKNAILKLRPHQDNKQLKFSSSRPIH